MTTAVEVFGGTLMSPVPDPYPVYRTLRRERPVLPLESPMGDVHLVTRFDDVLAVLKDPVTYSSRANARGIGLVMGRTILEMDGKEHLRHRNLIAGAFVPRALTADLRGVIAAVAGELIDRFARDGRADLVAQFSFTLPIRVIAHIIGIPVADYEQFHGWALDIIGMVDDPFTGLAAAGALVDYLRPILAERRRAPADDLLSKLVHAEVDGHRLDEEEVLSFLRLLLPAGAETTYRLIGSALFALLTHPDVLASVRADPGALDSLIEETLRWESPVQFVSRETTASVSVDGVDLPAGAMVMCALGSANRDESHYADPDRFDLARRADDHVAFGFGRHFCAGSHLARLEARIALGALLERLPNLRLAGDARILGLAFRSPDRLPVVFDA